MTRLIQRRLLTQAILEILRVFVLEILEICYEKIFKTVYELLIHFVAGRSVATLFIQNQSTY